MRMFCDDAPVSFDAKVNDLIEKKIKEAKTSKMWYDMHSAPRDGIVVLLLIKNSKNETFWVGLGLAACAAGLSAAWNGILQPIFTTATQESDGERNG